MTDPTFELHLKRILPLLDGAFADEFAMILSDNALADHEDFLVKELFKDKIMYTRIFDRGAYALESGVKRPDKPLSKFFQTLSSLEHVPEAAQGWAVHAMDYADGDADHPAALSKHSLLVQYKDRIRPLLEIIDAE